jgi:hypothetical protein
MGKLYFTWVHSSGIIWATRIIILIASIFSSIHFQYKHVSFIEKFHFRPKLSQHVNTPFKDKMLIISHKISAKLPLSIFVKDEREVTFTPQSVSKVTVVTTYINLSKPM